MSSGPNRPHPSPHLRVPGEALAHAQGAMKPVSAEATAMTVGGPMAKPESDLHDSLLDSGLRSVVRDPRTFLSRGAKVIREDIVKVPVSTAKARAVAMAMGLSLTALATPAEVHERQYRGKTYPSHEAALAAQTQERERGAESLRQGMAEMDLRNESARGEAPLGRQRYQPTENHHAPTDRGNPWQALYIAAIAVGVGVAVWKERTLPKPHREEQKRIEELPDGY